MASSDESFEGSNVMRALREEMAAVMARVKGKLGKVYWPCTAGLMQHWEAEGADSFRARHLAEAAGDESDVTS